MHLGIGLLFGVKHSWGNSDCDSGKELRHVVGRACKRDQGKLQLWENGSTSELISFPLHEQRQRTAIWLAERFPLYRKTRRSSIPIVWSWQHLKTGTTSIVKWPHHKLTDARWISVWRHFERGRIETRLRNASVVWQREIHRWMEKWKSWRQRNFLPFKRWHIRGGI